MSRSGWPSANVSTSSSIGADGMCEFRIDGLPVEGATEACDADSLLLFIRALAICKINALLELRSPEVPSLHTEEPEIIDPVSSEPDSHVVVLSSSRGEAGLGSSYDLIGESLGLDCFMALSKRNRKIDQQNRIFT